MSTEGTSSIGSCMAFSADLPAAETVVAWEAVSPWADSGEVVTIGDFGEENEVITIPTVCNGVINKVLGATNYGQQAILAAYKYTNAAQVVLRDAAKSKAKISVRETLSSGDIAYYLALVAMAKTQTGGTADYLRFSVTLELISEPVIDPAA